MARIERLPLELIRAVADHLENPQDLRSLTEADPGLKRHLLSNKEYNREQLKRLAPKSLEWELADASTISWRDALVNVLEREHNLAAGKPVDITSFPVRDDFLYQEHTLLILRDQRVDLYDIHTNEVKPFFDLCEGLPDEAKNSKPRLVHYSSKVLSIRLEGFGPGNECRLAIFRVPDNDAPELLLLVNVPWGGSEVVRNNDTNAVVGTHTRTSEGWSWRFAWFSLETQSATRLYEIGNFNSYDVGTNIVFEILDDCFWVVTSEVTVDPEGADPVSYYGGCRVNLSKPGSRAEYWRIYRRKQTEGPIHDSFTRLALVKHEKEENTYLVVESRAEWLKPDKVERSIYTTIFRPHPLEPEDPDLTRPLAYEDLARVTRQDDFDSMETLIATADDSSLSVFSGVRCRQMEYGPDMPKSKSAAGTDTFRAGQLLHSVCHPQRNTWVDVVWDVASKFTDQAKSLKNNHILRLRTGSRRVGRNYNTIPKNDQDNIDLSELAVKLPAKSTDTPELDTSSPIYRHQPITLFPTNDASLKQLRRFEIPGHPSAEKLKIFSDDRCIVFGLREPTKRGSVACERNIIVVNFDPMAKWGLHRYKLDSRDFKQQSTSDPVNAFGTLALPLLTEQAEKSTALEPLILGSNGNMVSLEPKDINSTPPLQYESDGIEREYDDQTESSGKGEMDHERVDKGKGRRRRGSMSNPSSSSRERAIRGGSTGEVACSPAQNDTPLMSGLTVPSTGGPSKTQKKKRRASNSSVSTVYDPCGPFSTYYDEKGPPQDSRELSDAEQTAPAGKRPRTGPASDSAPEDPSQQAVQIATSSSAAGKSSQDPATFEEGLRQRKKEYSGSEGDYPSSASEDRHHAEELFPEYRGHA